MTLVPYLKASGEHKSKPTQHSVKELQGMGISPDIIVLRCDEPIEDESIFRKIANFCNVESRLRHREHHAARCCMKQPLMLEKAHMGDAVCRELGLGQPKAGSCRVGGNGRAASTAATKRVHHRARRQIYAAA